MSADRTQLSEFKPQSTPTSAPLARQTGPTMDDQRQQMFDNMDDMLRTAALTMGVSEEEFMRGVLLRLLRELLLCNERLNKEQEVKINAAQANVISRIKMWAKTNDSECLQNVIEERNTLALLVEKFLKKYSREILETSKNTTIK